MVESCYSATDLKRKHAVSHFLLKEIFVMKRFMLILLALLVSGSLIGCKKKASAPAPATRKVAKRAIAKNVDTSLPGDPVAGAKIYARICLACHGANGRGNGGMTAADFIKDTSRLAKDNKVLLNSIANGIKNGMRVMPAQKGVLSKKEMKDALSYIRKTFGKKKK